MNKYDFKTILNLKKLNEKYYSNEAVGDKYHSTLCSISGLFINEVSVGLADSIPHI